MPVRPLFQLFKRVDVVTVLDKYYQTITSFTRPLAFAFEAIMVLAVDVFGDFVNVALGIDGAVAAIGHVIAEIKFAPLRNYSVCFEPCIFYDVLACLLPSVDIQRAHD